MSTPVLVSLLTALAAVIVALTWLRLTQARAAGSRHQVSSTLRTSYTVVGALAIVVWSTFLVAGEDTALGSAEVGIVGLGLWWLICVLGLYSLTRWQSSGGRRVAATETPSWWRGPGLSILGQVLVVVSVVVFTSAYLTHAV